jgi:serine/threonine-protein kinase
MVGFARVLGGRYVLGAKVGEGGMGVVWRAFDRRLDREVAIKLLHPQVAALPEQRQRFDREARVLAALAHENIVRVYDYAESGDEVFLVLEFVDGESLERAVAGRLPLGWQRARGYAAPVCRALGYAHEQGVIHRDLTPANILLESATGRVVVTDFGLARVARGPASVTSAGVLVGTPEYWSPEQATGTDNDPSTDMYALGCVLFMLLSARLPFEGEDRLAVGLRRAHEDAPSLAMLRPGLPTEATRIVDALLRRDHHRRPSAHELISLLAPRLASAAPTLRIERPAAAAATLLAASVSEKPTTALAPTQVGPGAADEPPAPRRRLREAATLAVVASLVAAGAAVAVFRAASLGIGSGGGAHSPETIALPRLVGLPVGEGLRRLRLAAERISAATPVARITRVYSERAPNGVIVRQRPTVNARLSRGSAGVALTVSRGSAVASVPAVAAGSSPAFAAARITAAGFETWRRFTPSWTVREGNVVGVIPSAGAKVRRPARVTILIASGYPKSRVPTLRGLALPAAESVLGASHLRAAVAYVPSQTRAGRVISQSPPPGSVSVRGHTVQLNVGRDLQWTRLLSQFGSGVYRSAPFTVSHSWRIRYRCGSTYPWGFVLTSFSWTGPDDLSDGFTADSADGVHTVYPPSGPGTFQLQVVPYAPASTWYVEVDQLE